MSGLGLDPKIDFERVITGADYGRPSFSVNAFVARGAPDGLQKCLG